ncbi:uncharacterized protein LOC144620619 [Crassostrea virginica]
MFISSETGFQHPCESVFVRLCQIVGISVQLAIRSETVDIKEMVQRQVAENDEVIVMESGSMREGFRLKGSDVDIMYWLNNCRVIWDMCQSEYYYTENKTLILSDSSESPPGFTLLELLTVLCSDSRHKHINTLDLENMDLVRVVIFWED